MNSEEWSNKNTFKKKESYSMHVDDLDIHINDPNIKAYDTHDELFSNINVDIIIQYL